MYYDGRNFVKITKNILEVFNPFYLLPIKKNALITITNKCRLKHFWFDFKTERPTVIIKMTEKDLVKLLENVKKFKRKAKKEKYGAFFKHLSPDVTFYFQE